MESYVDTRIPALPSVALQIFRFDPDDPDASSIELEGIIAPDKGICSEILRISNSAFYGRSGEVAKLNEAISLLGAKSVKNLIILISSRTLFSQVRNEFMIRHLNLYPVLCAIVGGELAHAFNRDDLQDDVFVAGLLHRIGMTIFALNEEAAYERLIKAADENYRCLRNLENGHYGLNHSKIGADVFRKWRLPEQLTDTALQVDFKEDELSRVSDIVRITALSSLIVRQFLDLSIDGADERREHDIFCYYNAASIESEFESNQLQRLHQHPFFIQAVSV